MLQKKMMTCLQLKHLAPLEAELRLPRSEIFYIPFISLTDCSLTSYKDFEN
ncbi:hypothetical protein Bca4012_010871 [Brassica carinata]